MAKSCPKCKEVECEECPEWIFTLADLIMCMMGLFVILWVMKPGGAAGAEAGAASEATKKEEQRLVEVIAAIREAFGHVPDPNSTDPIDMQILLNRTDGIIMPKGRGDGGETIRQEKSTKGTDREVTSIRIGPQAAIGTKLVFGAGSVDVSADAMEYLDELAGQIRGHQNIIMIKGHSSLDDFPPETDQAEAMALSVKRAQAVADELVSRGVAPEVLRVVGCGTYEPVVQRQYTPDAQRMNRRVEVEVTPTLIDDMRRR